MLAARFSGFAVLGQRRTASGDGSAAGDRAIARAAAGPSSDVREDLADDLVVAGVLGDLLAEPGLEVGREALRLAASASASGSSSGPPDARDVRDVGRAVEQPLDQPRPLVGPRVVEEVAGLGGGRELAGTLSGGEQQMLALSCALASDPAISLLDELSMGLAPIIVEQLYDVVAQVASQGVSILVVEQFAQAVLSVADVAAIMLHGRITKVGAPADIEAELSAAYLGG